MSQRGAEREGDEHLRGRLPVRTASTTTIGSSAATAPLTLMSAESTATAIMISVVNERGLVPARVTSCWPALPPVARGIQTLTDDEERRDEDDHRVSESREGLFDGEHAGQVQESATPIATIPTGILLATNAADRQSEDDERDNDGIHRAPEFESPPTSSFAQRPAWRHPSRVAPACHRA